MNYADGRGKTISIFFWRDPLRRTYGSAPPLNLPGSPDNGFRGLAPCPLLLRMRCTLWKLEKLQKKDVVSLAPPALAPAIYILFTPATCSALTCLLYQCLECLLEVENVLAVDADPVCCAGPMYVVLFHTVDFRDGERLVVCYFFPINRR